MVLFFWSIRMNEHKKIVADWISGCDDMLAEIKYLLDKAYPDGAEDKFYNEWEIVLEHTIADKGVLQ
jgi:hypothetical protein